MSFENYYTDFLHKNPYPRTLKTYDRNLLNFSSNDYLGLSNHPLLIARAQEYAELYGIGAASSRSVSGNIAIYEQLETQLAQALGKPAALILGTGYQANVSVLEALLDKSILGQEPLVFADRLCHVSMLTHTRHIASLYRYQHNDLHHLQRLLTKYADSNRPKFILAESIYSMDGDQADLPALIDIAQQNNAFLYIDDAHAIGLYGANGWGMTPAHANKIDLIMGTFSKGCGSFGAYVACSKPIRDFLINRCKGFIYSTALSPAILGAISAVIEIMPMLEPLRNKVMCNADTIRAFFDRKMLNYGASNTHIIPWIIGDPSRTLRASQLLAEEGILGATIRPPSVLPGTSRIRFCITAAHSEMDLERLMAAIQKVEPKL